MTPHPGFVALLLMSSTAAAATAVTSSAKKLPQFFEEGQQQGSPVWRAQGISVGSDRFTVEIAGKPRRLQWLPSLNLSRVSPESLLESRSYELRTGAQPLTLRHASRIRAQGKAGISVAYYFGPRGLEFDIECDPGFATERLILESLDGAFSVDAAGGLRLDSEPLALRPVAYTIAGDGQRVRVESSFELIAPDKVRFSVAKRSSTLPLVIDPVLVYATYLDNLGVDRILGLHELEDGSLIVVSGGGLLSGWQLGEELLPMDSQSQRRCTISKLAIEPLRLVAMAYLEAGCGTSRVDSQGRILLAGWNPSPGVLTADAQHRIQTRPQQPFLARIAPSLRTIEYSSYLEHSCNTSGMLAILPIAGDSVYVVCEESSGGDLPPGGYLTSSPRGDDLLIVRYDLAQRRATAATYFTGAEFGGAEYLSGAAVSPSGEVLLYGSTTSKALPLVRATQSTLPEWEAGFVAAFSADLKNLNYSSYVGGLGGITRVSTVAFGSAGMLHIGGSTSGEVPGLESHVDDRWQNAFTADLVPGESSARSGYVADREGFGVVQKYVVLPNGRHCVITRGRIPGGEASERSLFGCLDAEHRAFEFVSGIQRGSALLSRRGGLWVAASNHEFDEPDPIPPMWKDSVLQGTPGQTLLTYSLLTAKPELRDARIVVPVLFGGVRQDSYINGRNFVGGMYLDFAGVKIPVVVHSPVLGRIASDDQRFIRAGVYWGHLVVPGSPPSDPVEIHAAELPPDFAPVTPPVVVATSDPVEFRTTGPVYPDTIVMWRGKPLNDVAYEPVTKSLSIKLPAGEAAVPGSGEFTITNPGPAGGVRRQSINIRPGPTFDAAPICVQDGFRPAIDADSFQVDRARNILYGVNATTSGTWVLSSYSLPSLTVVSRASIPRIPSTRITDFRLSADGSALYIADERLTIRRFKTTDLEQDLEWHVPTDAPRPSSDVIDFRLRTIGGGRSVAVSTPGGRILIFDDGKQRAYTSADFPSKLSAEVRLITATGSALYASGVCVVRYPFDDLGLAQPEELCDLTAAVDRHPDLRLVNGRVLVDIGGAVVTLSPTTSVEADPAALETNPLRMETVRIWFDRTTRTEYGQIVVTDESTGKRLGHFPRSNCLATPQSAVRQGEMMLIQTSVGYWNQVIIIPDWRSEMEWYE